MAQGDLTLFEEFADQLGESNHDFTTTTGDDIYVSLITTVPVATQSTPTKSDYAECTGGTYVKKQITTATYAEVGGVATFDGDNVTWAQDQASGPTDVKAALIYNEDHASDMAIGYVDLTPDAGTTPISLKAGDININWNESGIFTVTVS